MQRRAVVVSLGLLAWAVSSIGDAATAPRYRLKIPSGTPAATVAVYAHAHLLNATDALQDSRTRPPTC